jgi:predicted RNA-binding Zn ribbon-like protein
MAIARDFVFFGRLSLDFAQTGDMGYGTRFERLTVPSELQRWLSLSPLRLSGVKTSREDLGRAKVLRGAIWRVAEAALGHTPPASADVRLVNRMACQPGLVRRLDRGGRSMGWHRPTTVAALATIAQDAVVLLGDPAQRSRLRRCENPGCRAVFHDDSRPGGRRWCASNRCGDRIRARIYRGRHRS